MGNNLHLIIRNNYKFKKKLLIAEIKEIHCRNIEYSIMRSVV